MKTLPPRPRAKFPSRVEEAFGMMNQRAYENFRDQFLRWLIYREPDAPSAERRRLRRLRNWAEDCNLLDLERHQESRRFMSLLLRRSRRAS